MKWRISCSWTFRPSTGRLAWRGGVFEGLYDFNTRRLSRPVADNTRAFEGDVAWLSGLEDAALNGLVSTDRLSALRDEAELALGGYASFDAERYRAGDLTPVISVPRSRISGWRI